MEIKEVADGYGRNFLIARRLAMPATEEALTLKNRFEKEKGEEMKALVSEKDAIQKTELVFTVKAGEHGEIFGSVTKDMIQKMLHDKGFAVASIELEKPLKKTGAHILNVGLGKGIRAKINVIISPQ